MSSGKIILKEGREKSLLQRHQWIFSGAVQKIDGSVHDGDCISVISSTGNFLGKAFVNTQSSIIGRLLSLEDTSVEEAIEKSIHNAVELRRKLFGSFSGKMFRLVNAEADMLSGLVIDMYDTAAVIQISSLGMEKNKSFIVKCLLKELFLTWIYEKSTSPSRKQEGLSPNEGTLFGQEQERVVAEEEGLKFVVSIKDGQKTGFFIDHREMRQLVRRFAHGKRVLNCFSYTGGFSVAALSGGALSCTSIDVSQPALFLLAENLKLNDLNERHTSICADVFEWLEKETLFPFDIMILDPPAFAKKKHDVEAALRGYREINRRALQKMPSQSFLLTSSCSYHVDQSQFLFMLKKASLDAKRNIRLLSYHHHAWDHPCSLFHPETEYLKSAFLYVE